MSNLFRTKDFLTIGQLARAWSVEVAQPREDRKESEQNLLHILLEDIVNGRLDNSGPDRDGRKLGLRRVGDDSKAIYCEGNELLAKIRVDKAWVLDNVLVMKEAILDFARRRQLAAPSWWITTSDPPTSSGADTIDVLAPVPKRPSASRGKQPRIIKYLAEKYPTGVAGPGLCPRKELKGAILEQDPTLKPLDDETLKKAIAKYNTSLGSL